MAASDSSPAGIESRAGGLTVDASSHNDATATQASSAMVRRGLDDNAGLAYWQGRYARFKAKNTIAWDNLEEENWTFDDETMQAFALSLAAKISNQIQMEISPDEQHSGWFKAGEAQALERHSILREAGEFGGLPESTIYELLPSEQTAFSLMVVEVTSRASLEDYSSIEDLSLGTSPFIYSPEELIERFWPELDASRREEAQSMYSSALLEYLGARGQYENIRNLGYDAAMELGLYPPHDGWLPAVWPEAGALQNELQAMSVNLWSFYASLGREPR